MARCTGRQGSVGESTYAGTSRSSGAERHCCVETRVSHFLDSALSRLDVRLDITDVYLFRGEVGTVFVMNGRAPRRASTTQPASCWRGAAPKPCSPGDRMCDSGP